MSVYGYVRVSTTIQAEEGESLSVQQRQLQAWCAMQDTTLDHIFVEAGVSGGKQLQQRPEGQALLQSLKRGDSIIATKLDRLFRSSRDALNLTHELRKAGVRLHTLDMGEITGEGLPEAMMTCAAAFATLERHHIKERIRTVKQDQRQRQRYLGGSRPFGYTVGADGALTPCDREQRIVEQLCQLSLTMSIRKARLRVIEQHGVSLSLWTACRIVQTQAQSQ